MAATGLCKTCEAIAFTMLAQKCPECKKRETNSAYKRCEKCAIRKGICAYCDAPLKEKKS